MLNLRGAAGGSLFPATPVLSVSIGCSRHDFLVDPSGLSNEIRFISLPHWPIRIAPISGCPPGVPHMESMFAMRARPSPERQGGSHSSALQLPQSCPRGRDFHNLMQSPADIACPKLSRGSKHWPLPARNSPLLASDFVLPGLGLLGFLVFQARWKG